MVYSEKTARADQNRQPPEKNFHQISRKIVFTIPSKLIILNITYFFDREKTGIFESFQKWNKKKGGHWTDTPLSIFKSTKTKTLDTNLLNTVKLSQPFSTFQP